MSHTTCYTDGCENPVHSKGLCQNHYRKNRRRELDPAVGTRKPGPKPDPTKRRSRYRTSPPRPNRATDTHCAQGHPWDEHTEMFSSGKRFCRYCSYVSRAKSEREPDSLEEWIERREKKKLFCPNNHEWSEDNTFIDSKTGYPSCRRCRQNATVKRMYQMTVEDLEERLAAQDHKCLICGLVFVEFGENKSKRPHIDHDHSCCPGKKSCGKCVRGLLCGNCNQGLGRFNDDPQTLAAALLYLVRVT